MQACRYAEIAAIASTNPNVTTIAAQNNIPVVYDTYEDLLHDPSIEAVYIPLPNHLHVTWAIQCLEAGKHVLCEKPIALSHEEAGQLLEVAHRFPGLRIMEAFMYRFHPQWQQALSLVNDGSIGELKTIQSFFSYFNNDAANIRNQPDKGGGGLKDIGCYCISLSRFIFNKEPDRVIGIMEYDPDLQTDRLTSGMLDFGNGTATFTCSTQAAPFQRVNIIGTEGRIEIEIPFNAPADEVCRTWLYFKGGSKVFEIEPVNQYTLQGDLFSKSILDDTAIPTPLEDAVNNMKVIDAIVESAATKDWKIII